MSHPSHPAEEADGGLVGRLQALVREYGEARVLESVKALRRERKRWVPTCGEKYEYTYHYMKVVEACPPSDDDEADCEDAAQKACEAQVKRYCARTKDCEMAILKTSPVGGGCVCADIPLAGTKCVCFCDWKVEYECKRKPS